MTGKPKVVILGAGPAGLGAAWRLAQSDIARVTVLEGGSRVGGNAGSFELAGQMVDYGSHRLHPSCDPEVLRDIRALLGSDLMDRPRHGRIRLQGRWIHFPLKPIDLALRLPPRFALGVGRDVLRKAIPHGRDGSEEDFAAAMRAGLGPTVCDEFYYPYARKLWGLAPDQLSVTQARRRVSANSPARMARKVLSAVPGLKPAGSGRFYYPRLGFGQICEAYARAAGAAGAEIHLGATVLTVAKQDDGGWAVGFEQNGDVCVLPADHVWSTLPLPVLACALLPALPAELLAAAAGIAYRGMILIYLVLEQDRFSPYDAHYFPGADVAISRLSEPKNYAGAAKPAGTTVLCAELPCAVEGPEWAQSDEELGRLVCDALARAGIPVQAPVRQVATWRLREAYPIYAKGYERRLDPLDDWLSRLADLLTFGRQGLFAHDNTHHALYMGYCAAACLEPDGTFDRRRWQAFRQAFAAHVVED